MSDPKTQEGVITLHNVRLAFTNLFEPQSQDGGKPKFSVASLIDKNSPDDAVINATMGTVAEAKWGKKAAEIGKQLKASDKLALHDGDAKSQYDGYAGKLFVNATNARRPLLIDRDAATPLTEADGRPYAGCYANVRVQIWAQDNEYGKRINASLLGVQFVRDGEPFAGGAVASVEDFAAIPEAETGDATSSGIFA